MLIFVYMCISCAIFVSWKLNFKSLNQMKLLIWHRQIYFCWQRRTSQSQTWIITGWIQTFQGKPRTVFEFIFMGRKTSFLELGPCGQKQHEHRRIVFTDLYLTSLWDASIHPQHSIVKKQFTFYDLPDMVTGIKRNYNNHI